LTDRNRREGEETGDNEELRGRELWKARPKTKKQGGRKKERNGGKGETKKKRAGG